jgi:hypothetical protein
LALVGFAVGPSLEDERILKDPLSPPEQINPPLERPSLFSGDRPPISPEV